MTFAVRAIAASFGSAVMQRSNFYGNSNVRRSLSTSNPAKYLCVHVFCSTKPGTEEQFRQATLKNARQSAMEEGIARFDVLQDKEDATKFVLVEVYKTADAPAKHKETAHYLEWRDTVADMMAEPRQARKFDNVFPATTAGWDYPKKDTDSGRLE